MAHASGAVEVYTQDRGHKWINRLDLCVLRQAVYEFLYRKQTPPKVIIDEAIELGKEFGSNSSAKFINGVLGNILKQLKKDPEIDESA